MAVVVNPGLDRSDENQYDLFSMTGDSMADSIQSLFTHKVIDEGDNVTLSCKYKPSISSGNYLHWYRQYPKSKPEFLLYILQSGTLQSDFPRKNVC
ncbi:hypothetical protein QTP86_020296 [Hemibagrus guttatus]|nr:hypothetical protein QTP86_020296 [Hemibagrus guttatus]